MWSQATCSATYTGVAAIRWGISRYTIYYIYSIYTIFHYIYYLHYIISTLSTQAGDGVCQQAGAGQLHRRQRGAAS